MIYLVAPLGMILKWSTFPRLLSPTLEIETLLNVKPLKIKKCFPQYLHKNN
jgi:hypothetical protein